MLFIIKKKSAVIFALIVVFVTSMFMKRSYELNNSIITTNTTNKVYVAIIIDDFGYNAEGTDEMLSLDIPFTAAVIPFLELTALDAQKAQAAGKDIIVHMGMEAYSGKKSWLGPKSIMSNSTDDEVVKTLDAAFEQIQGAVGINNHMGSKITENTRIMKDILKVTKDKDLVFVDSMTSVKSVTTSVANQLGANFFTRDVFLDSTQDKTKVKKKLQKLGDIALEKGYAVGIGHVGPEGGKTTAEAIKSMAPQLEEKGIYFVTLSQLRQIVYGYNWE
jgi:polysaccharide deacetylase 2 family uncharacterized protein YibQ